VILAEGRNCWRVARADRAAFLVDGAAYFAALREALARARYEVVILGWEVDSRARLLPGASHASDHAPRGLLAYLNHLLRRRPELRVYVLSWDFSLIYTFERELMPSYRFAWEGDPRLEFRLDNMHPALAAHHQKLVTIDRRVAFVGGIDLTIRRWDTPAHRAHERARVDPAGKPYAPTHDVQMIVDGAAARALGELAADRWRVAAGAPLPAAPADDRSGPDGDPWPAGLAPEIVGAPIGIARTQPALPDRPPAREVLALTLDAVAGARRVIYIENQFLTSAAVGGALAARLGEPAGPEIVIVLPRDQIGWLERSSMGVMQTRLVRKLLQADRHGRLRLLYPVVPGLRGEYVHLHSKLLIADDTLALVGSSNLTNRSMGLDTECNLAVDATADGAPAGVRGALLAFRNRLLAEHLGTERSRVEAAIAAAGGSVIAAIEALGGGPRSLAPLPLPSAEPSDAESGLNLALLDGLVVDSEQPAPDLVLDDTVSRRAHRPALRSILGWTVGLAIVTGLAAVWRFTPLRGLLDVHRLAALGRALAALPAAPALVVGLFVAGALLFFPITVLLGATALVFPPGRAVALGLSGALAGALVTYGAGRLVGRFRPRWLERPGIERVRQALERRGVLAMVVLRLLPVGNFTLVNLAAGAMGVRLHHFVIGSLIGLLPGVVALTAFADRLAHVLLHPGPRTLLLLGVVAAALLAALAVARRLLRKAVQRSRGWRE
jgi:phosphatidylserine/phosphatidylglycerophosphate/cardiolipin synthase-like enzyme/uncharacterized membrane protein YdjX (TVP38/TMEM64 family)